MFTIRTIFTSHFEMEMLMKQLQLLLEEYFANKGGPLNLSNHDDLHNMHIFPHTHSI